MYPGSQLTTGKQTNAFLLVRNGTIDFAVQSSINYSPQLVELNLFALPFFIANQPHPYKALDAIKNGKAGMIIKAIEDKGVKFPASAKTDSSRDELQEGHQDPRRPRRNEDPRGGKPSLP
ncbi:hypothetical protein MASR2M79_04570 [Aminivibrio sp.]